MARPQRAREQCVRHRVGGLFARRFAAVGTAIFLALLFALASAGAASAHPSLPAAAARAQDGGAPNLVYVAGSGTDGNDLTLIDIGNKNVSGHITVGGKPHAVALSFDNREAFVTQSAANTLAVVDAQAKQVSATIPVGTNPTALALDIAANANRVFVVNTGSDTVSVVEPDTRHIDATIRVGHTPTGVAEAGPSSGIADINSAEIYVTNSGSDTVTVIDDNSLKVLTTIGVPGGPESVVIPQNGGTSGIAYVGTQSGAIVAIRLADHKVLGTVMQLGGPAGQMDYNATNGQIYVPDPAKNVVQVLRPVSPGSPGSSPSLPPEPLRTLSFAGGPDAVAIPNDGSYAFVALGGTGRVAIYDLTQHATVATLDIGGAPSGMVTGSYPPIFSSGASQIVSIVLTLVILATLGLVAYLFIRAGRRKSANKPSATDAQPESPAESLSDSAPSPPPPDAARRAAGAAPTPPDEGPYS